jgi:hypothetical protein
VRDRLQIERNESIVLCADPYCGHVRRAALRVAEGGVIKLATILNWTPRLTKASAADGCPSDPEDADGSFVRPPAPLSASRQKWTAKRGNKRVVAGERRLHDLG